MQVAGNIGNSNTATVQASGPASGGVLYASRVQVSAGIGGKLGQDGRVQGLVTNIASSQQFSVGEQVVQTNLGTHFVLHGRSLSPNLEVKVHVNLNELGCADRQTGAGATPDLRRAESEWLPALTQVRACEEQTVLRQRWLVLHAGGHAGCAFSARPSRTFYARAPRAGQSCRIPSSCVAALKP